ncbi:Protein Asterix [Camellia lanceoleosa]|uniref:Protein Asterix n=1 Tax=Camellia lanceoleosa TaxID=1840588 RepID=A0ACC0GXY7_9ERIC|nr:Protein Asterix [Camellia lanceoleosa]
MTTLPICFDSVYRRVLRVIKEWSNVNFTEMPKRPSFLMFVMSPTNVKTKRRGLKIAQCPDDNGVMLGLLQLKRERQIREMSSHNNSSSSAANDPRQPSTAKPFASSMVSPQELPIDYSGFIAVICAVIGGE